MPVAANHGTDMITKIVPIRPPIGVRFATPTISLWVASFGSYTDDPPLKYLRSLPIKKGAHRSERPLLGHVVVCCDRIA